MPLRRADSGSCRYAAGDRWVELRLLHGTDAAAVAEAAIDRDINRRPLEPADPGGLVDVVVGLLFERITLAWWRDELPTTDAYQRLRDDDRDWLAAQFNQHIADTEPLK